MRPRSITEPIVLVIVGVLFLLNNLGHNIPIWSYLVDYWPFLLIGMGVIGLAEVLLHVSRGSAPPRPMSGGVVFWIVVLCIILAIWGAHRDITIARINSSGGISILGSDFDYAVNADSSAQGATRLVLDNISGDVTIHGGDGGDLKVTGHKTVRAFNRGDADRADRASQIRVERQGDSLVVRVDQPTHSGLIGISTGLDIVAPRGLDVEARDRGDLSIQDMAGAVRVTGSRGDVRLSNIGRDVRVEAARGGLVRVEGVKGSVDLQGRGGDVQMENIDGQVTINGEFSGTMEFRALAKALHFQSSQTDFRVEQIPGLVTMDLGNLRIDNVVGPVKFHTGSRDIDAGDVTDSLDLNVNRGDIRVSASKSPLPTMDLHSRHGDITLTLPDKAGFDLDGRTGAGEIENDFGSPLQTRNDGRSATIKGRVGSGPTLAVVTDRGTLSVKKK